MFGDRLELARKRSGLSLRGLSESLDGLVSAQAIGKYERGAMMPSSRVLMALANRLDVSIEFLLSEQVEALEFVRFRKHSSTTAAERSRVEAEVIDFLQRYLAVEEILGLEADPWIGLEAGRRFVGLECEAEIVADDVRAEWDLGIDPIPNVTSLLEDKGIKVILLPLPERISGLTCQVRTSKRDDPITAVVVNRNSSLERRRLTLAHELAHQVLDEASPVDQEKAANVFAGALLVPREHLVAAVGERRRSFSYTEAIHLKRMYRVSGAALLMRLGQTGILDRDRVAHTFKTFARTWRSSEPEPLESQDEQGEHETPRRFERLCFQAISEQHVTAARGAELLRSPLVDVAAGLRGPDQGHADHRQ